MILKTNKLYFIILLFCYLLAFALSIKSFREPDLWWQIRTGEWILENHSVPSIDVFSYTMNGAEWINIKWGFEVLAAIVSGISGAESVYILQAIVSVMIVFFLLKIVKLFFPGREFNLSAYALGLMITLIGIEYRMIGRPEMISHLLTLVFLYYLISFRNTSSKKIFLLIPLQILWANMHEAFGTGIVLIAIFTIASWIEYFIVSDEGSMVRKKNAITLSILLPASIAAVCFNPNGFKLISRPLNILSQVYENKFTTELHSFMAAAYWEKEAFLGLLIFAFSIVGFFMIMRDKKKLSLLQRLNKAGFGYLISWLAFLYLALTAYRNIAFFIIVSFPVLYFILSESLNRLKVKFNKVHLYIPRVVFILLFAFYILVVSNKYYELTNSRNRFGLEVLAVSNPVDAADFIEQHGMKDKKCFSDYLISSCLLWKLQPSFQTFIDLRDFDVFPREFFNQFLITANYPEEFHKLDNIQQFEYVVLYRPQFKELHSYLYNDSVYACVYVDPVAAVYQKTDIFTREDIFAECKPVGVSAFSTLMNHLLNPFYEKYNYSDFNFDYAAASYYIDVKQYELARVRSERILSSGKEKDKGYEMLGNIYFEQAMHVRDSATTNNLLMQAGNYFSESVRMNEDNINSQLGLGHILLMRKNYRAALDKFEKCLEVDSKNYNAHVMSAESCKMLLRANNKNVKELSERMLEHFLSAEKINPGNPYILFNIGYAYFIRKNCAKAVDYLKRIQDDPNLNTENRKVAKSCIAQCGGKQDFN